MFQDIKTGYLYPNPVLSVGFGEMVRGGRRDLNYKRSAICKRPNFNSGEDDWGFEVCEPDTYHGYNCDCWDLSEGSMLIRGTRI